MMDDDEIVLPVAIRIKAPHGQIEAMHVLDDALRRALPDRFIRFESRWPAAMECNDCGRTDGTHDEEVEH